jgi:hypothetical protein
VGIAPVGALASIVGSTASVEVEVCSCSMVCPFHRRFRGRRLSRVRGAIAEGGCCSLQTTPGWRKTLPPCR